MSANKYNLRQKAVNVIYLVVLVLIFLLLPSEFIDSTFRVNKDYHSFLKASIEQTKFTQQYLLYLLRHAPEDSQEVNTKFKYLNLHTEKMHVYLEELKKQLVQAGGGMKNGFPKDGKRIDIPREVLINSAVSEKLLSKLLFHRQQLSMMLGEDYRDLFFNETAIDSLIGRSTGELASFESFYFDQIPLNAAMLNLTHHQAFVEKCRQTLTKLIIQEYVDDIRFKLTNDSTVSIRDSFKFTHAHAAGLIELNELLKYMNFIESKKDSSAQEQFSIVPLSDSLYEIGSLVSYKIEFNSPELKEIQLRLVTPEGIEKYNFYTSTIFNYVPQVVGQYMFEFNTANQNISFKIDVVEIAPKLSNAGLSTLFTNYDNVLNIERGRISPSAPLVAHVSRGKVYYKGDQIILRTDMPGPVRLEIYEDRKDNPVLIIKRDFIARDIIKPLIYLGPYGDGSTLTPDEISQINTLRVVSKEAMVEEIYSIMAYQVLWFNANGVSKKMENRGSNFNSSVISALTHVEDGDVLLFKNIAVKSNTGTEHTLGTLTINIKS